MKESVASPSQYGKIMWHVEEAHVELLIEKLEEKPGKVAYKLGSRGGLFNHGWWH